MTKNIPARYNSSLYAKMQNAIARCYSIDEYKEVASQASAIAEYYKQIHDDESVRKFLQIKIRAWRRIGEILINAKVDKASCNTRNDGGFNTSEYIRKIRACFKGDKTIEQLSESSFRQAIAIAEVPEEFFIEHITECISISDVLTAYTNLQRREWAASPEGKKEAADIAANVKKHLEIDARIKRMHAEEEAEAQAALEALRKAQAEAFDEVGITLERHDRKKMAQVLFLIKRELHDTLRQAAFDNHMTMQAILRAGLVMWLFSHGYNVSMEDVQPKKGRTTSNEKTKAKVRDRVLHQTTGQTNP